MYEIMLSMIICVYINPDSKNLSRDLQLSSPLIDQKWTKKALRILPRFDCSQMF